LEQKYYFTHCKIKKTASSETSPFPASDQFLSLLLHPENTLRKLFKPKRTAAFEHRRKQEKTEMPQKNHWLMSYK
jgi:hypothetical protein